MLATLLAGLLSLALPRDASACSCPAPGFEEARIFDGALVFAGEIVWQGQTTAVRVDRWFHGPGRAPVVRLDDDAWGDAGGDCTIPRIPPGRRWIFAVVPGADGEVPIELCSHAYELESEQGRDLLADAQLAFGPGVGVPRGADPTPGTAALEPEAARVSTAVILGAVGTALVLLLAVVALARRRA